MPGVPNNDESLAVTASHRFPNMSWYVRSATSSYEDIAGLGGIDSVCGRFCSDPCDAPRKCLMSPNAEDATGPCHDRVLVVWTLIKENESVKI